MENLAEKISIILSTEFNSDEIEVETDSNKYISGTITSSKFVDEEDIDRQRHVWKYLNQSLSLEEKEKILGLITLTPEERIAYQD